MSLLLLQGPAIISLTHGGGYANALNRRPTIDVELANTTPGGVLLGTTRTSLLVDSGADVTMLNSAHAQTLGIDLGKCEITQIGGIGQGSVQGRRATIKIYLCGRWVDVPVDFVVDQNPQLLGREGAFDSVLLAFAHSISVLLAAKA